MAKTETRNEHWKSFLERITNTARMLSLFAWTPEVSAEYLRHVMKSGCKPEAAERAFNEILETTGIMPKFSEVIANSVQGEDATAYLTGQDGTHLDYLPVRIKLAKFNPGDLREPTRYAMAYCGCWECVPKGPKPERAARKLTKWEQRAEELAPLGKKGFAMMLEELGKSGNPLGSIRIVR